MNAVDAMRQAYERMLEQEGPFFTYGFLQGLKVKAKVLCDKAPPNRSVRACTRVRTRKSMFAEGDDPDEGQTGGGRRVTPSLWFPARKLVLDGKTYKVDITVRVKPVVEEKPLEGFAKAKEADRDG